MLAAEPEGRDSPVPCFRPQVREIQAVAASRTARSWALDLAQVLAIRLVGAAAPE